MPEVTATLNQETIDRYLAGSQLGPLARQIGMPWQRLWVELAARGILRPTGATRRPRGRRAARFTTATPGQILQTLTYGIEIECLVPVGYPLSIGGYASGIQIPGLPEGWVAKSDGSIQATTGYRGVEVVSPKLQGASGFAQIRTVCEWMATVGAKVNRSTGFHVHVGWTSNHAALCKLVRLVAKNERGIYAASGSKQRETGSYCRPIAYCPSYARLMGSGRVCQSDRYRLLNITNVNNAQKRTVEFRVFSGTLSLPKVVTYVRLRLALVEKSQDQTAEAPEWSFNPIRDLQAPTGSEGMDCLLREIGWDGPAATVYGALTSEGTPDLSSSVTELRRLSRKYDEATTQTV